MGKVKAMVDGKNVTTDWIESVFDSADFVYDVRTIIGFINRCVVQARWDENKVTWTISRELGYGKHDQFTMHHQRIIDLVNAQMDTIRAYNRRRVKKQMKIAV